MSYQKEDIKLDDVMANFKDEKDKSVRVWHTPGFPIECQNHCEYDCPRKIPVHFTVISTFVVIMPKKQCRLAYLYSSATSEGIREIGDFSGLETLKKKFPQLFEVKGTLYVFP